jgi:arginase family enzyme
MNKENIVIMNFTGVYEIESFFKDIDAEWIDCKNIPGTFGYCDSSAAELIKRKIQKYTPYGIHFIDSGNFHYISKFWTDKIETPFSLCVFDHHTDMQRSLFNDILSCGNWIKTALDTNLNLKKVIIIGPDDKLLENIDIKYKDRLILYSQNELSHKETWHKLAFEHVTEPVYLSIDKDLLDQNSAITDWDQGNLSLNDLKSLLHIIIEKETIIGVDICGEYTDMLSLISNHEIRDINNKSNKELLKFFIKSKDKILIE